MAALSAMCPGHRVRADRFRVPNLDAPSGSTEAESFAGFGTSLITTNAATEGIDLNLFGLGIATGLGW